MVCSIFFFIITLMLVIPMTMLGTGSALLSSPIIFLFFLFFILKDKPSILSGGVIFSLFSYLIFVLSIAVVPFIHGSSSFELFKFVLYGLFVFINAIMLTVCYRCYYKNDFQYILLRNLYFVGSLNAVVTVLVLLSPEIKSIVYSIVDTSKINEEHLALGFRSSGLFFFGGSVMSLFHCLVIYIGLVYVKNKKTSTSSSFIIDLMLIVFNVLAVFLSGRMGALILLAGFLIILLTPSVITRAYKELVLKTIVLAASIFASVIVFFYNDFKKFIEWAFELFINIFSGNETTTASSKELMSMYRFPTDMIFGEGVFSMVALGIDSGYVLLTWYFGILAILAIFCFFLAQFLTVLKNCKNRDVFAVYVFCLLLILIGNVKDVYLFGSNGLTQIYFISMMLCLYNRPCDSVWVR